jgi:hypothetical protein
MVWTSNSTPHTSQLAAGQLRGYPTIPVFYHSTIPRQTNPISGRAEGRTSAVWIRSCDEWDTREAVKKQSQFLYWGFRIADCGLRIGDGAAREHLPAACYRWPAWAGCTNKPNFRVTGGTPMLRDALRRHYGQDFCAKQTQFGQEPFQGQVLCRQGVATNCMREEPR